MRSRELGLLLAAFLLTLPAVTVRIYASDEVQYYAYLRSLWFDHDVSFENEYRHFFESGTVRSDGFHDTFLSLETEAGRRPNFATIGSALLWAPFYAAGDAVTRVLRLTGSTVPADGYSTPYIAAVAFGSAFYGFAAVLLSIAAARRVFEEEDHRAAADSRRRTILAGALIWTGTPLLFYMYVAPPFAHACSAFAVALFVTVWLHVRRTWTTGGAAALGLAAALMVMVREQDAFLALGPAVDFLIHGRGARLSDWLRSAAAGLAAFGVGLLPQLAAYQALNGRPMPSTLVTRKMTWTAPHALDVLTSTSHGFLLWTPLAALAMTGLVLLAGRSTGVRRRIAGCALVMIAAQVYVTGSVESWTVAGAFGQRRFVALTVLLTIGLAALLRARASRPLRATAAVLVGLSVWWNLALIAQFGTRMMNRQRLELGRNAYAAFVTIPAMAPSLAWRYLTDRRHFYATDEHGRSATEKHGQTQTERASATDKHGQTRTERATATEEHGQTRTQLGTATEEHGQTRTERGTATEEHGQARTRVGGPGRTAAYEPAARDR
ncbi:MAG TPA: hypothetical protein VD833_09125 [Vicinamibacterales bacterium]|nr:hypothetical protein [Vicinamibacterales bacterium]